MAKRGTLDHPKTKRLARRMKLEAYSALGLLEAFWHLVSRYAPTGLLTAEDLEDFGDHLRFSDWQFLVECRWLDELEDGTYYVHDWHDHADDATKKALAKAGKTFANGSGLRRTQAEKTTIEPNEPIETESGTVRESFANETRQPSLAKPSLAKPDNPPNPLSVVDGGAPRDEPDVFDDPGEDENEDEFALSPPGELAKPEEPWWVFDESPGGKLAAVLASTPIKSKSDPLPYSHGKSAENLTRSRCDDLAARITDLDPGGDALESLLRGWNEYHEDRIKPPYKDPVRALGDWVTRREAEWRRLKKARGNGVSPQETRDHLREVLGD